MKSIFLENKKIYIFESNENILNKVTLNQTINKINFIDALKNQKNIIKIDNLNNIANIIKQNNIKIMYINSSDIDFNLWTNTSLSVRNLLNENKINLLMKYSLKKLNKFAQENNVAIISYTQ